MAGGREWVGEVLMYWGRVGAEYHLTASFAAV